MYLSIFFPRSKLGPSSLDSILYFNNFGGFMKRMMRLGVMIAAALAVRSIAFAGTAAPPMLISGACPSGSARATKWILFEDLNGDGGYDWVVAGDCDGSVRGRPWRAMSDPFDPTAEDIIIGQLPAGLANVNPELHYDRLPTGNYSWKVTERLSSGAEACSHERTNAMELTSTCPPPAGDLH
jgi:hypothetical protein